MTADHDHNNGKPVNGRYKFKSPGRVAAMKRLNESGQRGIGGRRPTHGRYALLELLDRGLDPSSPIAVYERELTAAYVSDCGGPDNISAMDKGLIKRLVASDLDLVLLHNLRDRAAKLPRKQTLELAQALARNAASYGQLVKVLGGPGRRPAPTDKEIVIRRFADANSDSQSPAAQNNDPPMEAFDPPANGV